MRLTQSQTQMLGMLVVGLVLYMMFNRYHSQNADAYQLLEQMSSAPIITGVSEVNDILMGTADFKSIGWTNDILQYYTRATPNSQLGVEIFNPMVNGALDAIDAMLEDRISFALPLTSAQSMLMKGYSEKYLKVLAQMTASERRTAKTAYQQHLQRMDPVSIGIIAGMVVAIGGMYTYAYVRSMELGYCVDHKCKQDAEAEVDNKKSAGKIASDCQVILKPGEKC